MDFKRCVVLDNYFGPEDIELRMGGRSSPLKELATHVGHWQNNGRPYVHVYPSIDKMLRNTKVQWYSQELLRNSPVAQLGSVHIRFVDRCFLLGITRLLCNTLVLVAFELWVDSNPKNLGSMGFKRELLTSDPNGNLFCKANYVAIDKQESAMITFADDRCTLLRHALGVVLLSKEVDFFEPSILKSDEKRRQTTDISILTDRARRRGKFGFELGRCITLCPHVRRPHFAVRWTGAGRSEARLVPIKGSIVHKSRVIEVPTGYDGKLTS